MARMAIARRVIAFWFDAGGGTWLHARCVEYCCLGKSAICSARTLLRIMFMLMARDTIISPGLSGFSSSTGFIAQLLTCADLFLLWNVILLVIGFAIADGLSRGKAVSGVPVVIVLVLLAQAGLGALSSSFGGLAVQRPFF